MPTITINGTQCEFERGERILDIANRCGVEIPYYCYHPGLSIPAQCRICLAEIHAPNPRNDNKLEPMAGGKLMPTCSTEAGDGMVVYTTSPSAVANQKAVMEYLLINHPLDCPVCDQAGECHLQDYSYKYGRGVSRFEESKVKQAKKNLGPNVYLYADRCIMCTRCVRFTREVPATGEINISGRGNRSEIDVFPSVPLENELSANVIDLCPVGALLDKDFLFAQRVWFLKSTPSIDGITASGDNITVEHNKGEVYRVKPRTNMDVNTWWITDEVRYGWKHVHNDRLSSPLTRKFGVLDPCTFNKAYEDTVKGLKDAKSRGKLLFVASPMLPCEEIHALASLVREIDPEADMGVGFVPVRGEDKSFPNGEHPDFVMHSEKAPNARGARRVLNAFGGSLEWDEAVRKIGEGHYSAVVMTAGYPGEWLGDHAETALDATDAFKVLIDTHANRAADLADVVLPGASWLEKAGTFENKNGVLQAFEQAIPCVEPARSEGQIANDLGAELHDRPEPEPVRIGTVEIAVVTVDEAPGQVPDAREVRSTRGPLFNAGDARAAMAGAMPEFADVAMPSLPVEHMPTNETMEVVEL